MLKQHNVENAEIPRPFDDAAPEPLIQQHKAVIEAEAAARLARAANNVKKDQGKVRRMLLAKSMSHSLRCRARFIGIKTTFAFVFSRGS